jgi:hypothetical protein
LEALEEKFREVAEIIGEDTLAGLANITVLVHRMLASHPAADTHPTISVSFGHQPPSVNLVVGPFASGMTNCQVFALALTDPLMMLIVKCLSSMELPAFDGRVPADLQVDVHTGSAQEDAF